MTDEIPVVFLTAALSAPIETRHRMCTETHGDDWGWKSHLNSQLPYTYTLTHTHIHIYSQTLRGKAPHCCEPASILLCCSLQISWNVQINYATHITLYSHTHTNAKIFSVLQLGTQLQWCHCLLPLCWLWLLLKAEHFDSASRVVTLQKL